MSSAVLHHPYKGQKIMQGRRVPWHIFGVSGIQGNVLEYPGKACECDRRKAIIGRGAR